MSWRDHKNSHQNNYDKDDLEELDRRRDYNGLRRKYVELLKKYKTLELQNEELRSHHKHPVTQPSVQNHDFGKKPTNVEYKGVAMVYDDNRGLYGKYHHNLQEALFKKPGQLNPFRDGIVEESKTGNRYFELLIYVTVSSGGRKINLLDRDKFFKYERRSKTAVIVDCRPKKRYESATYMIGDEDFPQDIELVYIMMPDGEFVKGEDEFNGISIGKLVKLVEKFIPKKKRGFLPFWGN